MAVHGKNGIPGNEVPDLPAQSERMDRDLVGVEECRRFFPTLPVSRMEFPDPGRFVSTPYSVFGGDGQLLEYLFGIPDNAELNVPDASDFFGIHIHLDEPRIPEKRGGRP